MIDSFPPALRRTGFAGPIRGVRHEKQPTVVRLWLPLTVIFLLLAPFAFLLIPILGLVPPARPFARVATIIGLGRLLLSLGGTEVDVHAPAAIVRIRIF